MASKMEITIFYSWQSDSPEKMNRYFIQDALEMAAKSIRKEGAINVEPVVDRGGRKGVPGMPEIASTILAKIDKSHVFVADVTIINPERVKDGDRPVPNPNVLFELGYAFKSKGPGKMVAVMNKAFGDWHHLPFDLRGRGIVDYVLSESDQDKSEVRRQLEQRLRGQLELVIRDIEANQRQTEESANPLDINIVSTKDKERSDGNCHYYRVTVMVTNSRSPDPVSDYYVELEFPRPFVAAPENNTLHVPTRSTHSHVFLRSGKGSWGPILFGDEKTTIVNDFSVDTDAYSHLSVTARVFVAGFEPKTVKKRMGDLENF